MIFQDLVTGREPRVVNLWEAQTSWTALALAHVRKLFRAGVRPGAHGINQAAYRVLARFRDRTGVDVSCEFVADGWAKWSNYDKQVRPEDVPADQPSRRHRAQLYWALPTAAPNASHAAARAFAAAVRAERAEMAEAAAATAPSNDAPAVAASVAAPTAMAKMTHLKLRELDDGTERVVRLTPKKASFERLALAHVQRMLPDVLPGSHGMNGPQLSVVAVHDDGTSSDVTVEFVRTGWRLWLKGDDYEELEAVPLAHTARRRRLEAHWGTR